ncbi:MAG: response regulator RpfG family c-di-GMP phosphodiesterase [Sulfurimonas sp.]|jgi:response regulator RpfG family c-di-GMP phosphodiesterase
MNIKKIIKLSFIVIVILIISIASINKIVFNEIENNTKSKGYISKLISIQEKMNRLVLDSILVTNIESLEVIEASFIKEERKFEKVKDDFIGRKDTFFVPYSKDLNIFYQNEKIIEDKFEKIYKLEKRKLNLKTEFSKFYPLENSLRKTMQKDIWKYKKLEIIKNFADLKYYSKEALYQHKNQIYLDKWLKKAKLLKIETKHELFDSYIKVADNLRKNVLQLNNIEENEKKLLNEIQEVLNINYELNKNIEKEIVTKLNEFINSNNLFLLVLSLFTVLFVIIIAYKVSKNIGISVDEIEEKIQLGLKEINDLNQEIEITQKEVVFTMGAIGESRSKETGNHVKRVAEYSKLLALYWGLDKKEAEMLKQASPMHDIGKVAIPDLILNKPGRFDEREREVMNTHAKLGYEMLKNSNRPLLKMAATVSYEHHEKWDGSGYPQGISGENIHIYGRITALADVFDALGSDRVYKKAWDDEKIFNLLKQERGKHFDPKLVDIFFEKLEDFLKIRDSFTDVNKNN